MTSREGDPEMAEQDIPPEILSAYVDGEASSDDAAWVARRAASDPRIARQIAGMQALRAGIGSLEQDVILLHGAPKPARRRLPRAAAMAAAALLGVALAGGGWWLGSQAPTSDPDTVLSNLIAHYDGWADTQISQLQPTGGASADTAALMRATGLVLVHEEVIALPGGGTAQHSGFLGENGCRVSVFRHSGQDDVNAPANITLLGRDDLLKAQWKVERDHYVIVARNMDSVRFATIAQSIRTASEAQWARDSELIVALEGARQRCVT